MLHWIKSKKIIFIRHLLLFILSSFFVYFVWRVNPTWSPDMRLWKAFGGWSFVLLFFIVFIWPAAKLCKPLNKLIKRRREASIWFFIIALVHTYLVLDGWVRWWIWEFLGYQYIPELDKYLRAEPWFWLANIMGAVALFFSLILVATSFDKVIHFIGMKAWKWLHWFAYVIFYLSALHVVYFAFMHYSPSPQRVLMGLPTEYPSNPLAYYYLVAILLTFVAQIGAFIKTIKQTNK